MASSSPKVNSKSSKIKNLVYANNKNDNGNKTQLMPLLSNINKTNKQVVVTNNNNANSSSSSTSSSSDPSSSTIGSFPMIQNLNNQINMVHHFRDDYLVILDNDEIDGNTPLTTEEEFKKMENAVNNLLISKNQIEQLKNERNTLIQIYEAKINEQNEQIKYLHEENLNLKLIINSMKLDLNSNINNNNNNNNNNISNKNDINTWNSKYQLYLDNIVIQLLNALKIQENIFIEYSKLEKNKKIKNIHTNIKHSTSNSYIKEHHTGFCTTSNSWTFNNGKSYGQNQTDLIDDFDSYFDELDNHNNYSVTDINENNSFNKFQHLLIQQQRQQINILNDLTQLSKSLKSLNMTCNSKKLVQQKQPTNQKPCISSPLPIAQTNPPESAKPVAIKQQSSSNQKSSLIIKVTSNDSKYHSQCKLQSKSSPAKAVSIQQKSNFNKSCTSNNEKASQNDINKNSKIPKFSNKNNSNPSLTNQNVLNFNKKQTNETNKKQVQSSVSSNRSKIAVNSKTTRGQSSSKIPQPRVSRISKEDNSRNVSKSSDLDITNQSNKYNTYTVKNKKHQANSAKKIIINSNTFDKTESSSSSQHLEFPQLQEEQQLQQPPIDILLVPVKTENDKVVLTSTSLSPNKNLVISSNNRKKSKEDEGYSTMSNELMNQIKIIDPSSQVTSDITAKINSVVSGNDTDSGITRVSHISADGSDSTSTPVSSLNHSPISQQQGAIATTLKITNPNFQLQNQQKVTKPRKTKRYCFPTLKSFSYYYNNRYYHQYHQNQNQSFICCKYLSDTDITSLVNQLSSYDKDISFNVFHLDTLYNNVDYILFNSYASDTELAYNYNRRHGKNQHFLNSNYKLYINDYFNQPYDGEEVDLDRSSNNSSNNNPAEEEIIIPNDQLPVPPTPVKQKIIDYELKGVDKYEFELDENEEEQEIEVDYQDQDDYYFNLYNNEYLDYENVLVADNDETGNDNNDKNNKIIELTVDDNLNQILSDDNDFDYYHNNVNNLLFDDDDLLMMISDSNKKKKNKHKNVKKNNVNSSFLFSSDSILSDSSSLSSPSLNSSSNSSSSSCSCPSSSNSSSDEDNSDMSMDSINYNDNIKNKTCKHGRRHHKRHDYFIDRIDKYSERYEKYSRQESNENYNHGNIDNDLDEFVRQLNIQCNLDKALQTSKNTSKRLKELNMMAVNAVVNATASATNNDSAKNKDDRVIIISRPPLVRRHTITSMPLNSACLNSNHKNTVPQSPQLSNRSNMARQSPSKYLNSKDYVGSFNKNSVNNKTNSLDYKNRMVNSNTENSIANSCGSYYNLPDNKHKKHFKRRNTINSINVHKNKKNNAIDFSGMGSPIKLNNDFNTDFYKLCSDTFFNNGSDLNLHKTESISSIINKDLKVKPLEILGKVDNSSDSSQNFLGHQDNVVYETNLTSHVNNLFDHWLHHNSSIIGTHSNIAD